jgi:cytidylate kinase
MNKNIIIAIDGNAASGKGTLARKLAKNFNYAYLDTGKLYRASALLIKENDINYKNIQEVISFIRNYDFSNFSFNNNKLKSNEIGKLASLISSYKELRKILLVYQREFATTLNKNRLGAILDGRDIGTVVLPKANIKFFITASIAVRTERRWKELISLEQSTIKRHVEKDIRDRDKRDTERKHSPLIPSKDAVLIDTTNLDANEVFLLAKKHIVEYLKE